MPAETIVLVDERGTAYEVEVRQDGTVAVAGRVIASSRTHAGEMRVGGRTMWAAADGDVRWVFVDGQVYTFEVQRRNAATRRRARHDGGLSAPMPATVIRIPVRTGDSVRAGDVVLILEAMKMELPIRATVDGTVTAVRCREGELVQPGEDLIDISSAEKG